MRKCVYNVFTTGTGEIISGRVVTAAAVTLSGASISAARTGGGTYTSTSNARGIYALSKVPSDSEYTISVTKAGYTFAPVVVTTGTSTDYSDIPGNKWSVDLVANGNPPVAIDVGAATVEGASVGIALIATDDGIPNPPGKLTYVITTLPGHGTLTDPGTGIISTTPHPLSNYGGAVVYAPSSGFTGQDTFVYVASDGGAPPEGGDSNAAAVRVIVANPCGQPLTPVAPAPGEEVENVPTDTMLSWASDGNIGVLENTASTCDDFALARINTTLGLTGQILSWASVAGATAPNLRATYDVIYFTTNPSVDDYGNLRTYTAMGSVLEQFTALGGVLLLDLAGNNGSQNDIGPGGLDYSRFVTHDAEVFTTPTHPYLTGAGFGGAQLTAAMFSNWIKTDHGNLLQSPFNSVVVLSNSDGASMVEYPWGAGKVIATTVTLGWEGAGSEHAGAPWNNELLYAASGIGTCATKYDVYLGTSPIGMSLIAQDLTEPARNPGLLNEKPRYYWKVVAKRTQLQAESAVWSFVTGYDYSKTVAQAKLQPDGRALSCGPSAVTFVESDTFYIEALDRASGIRVYSPGHGLSAGSLVKVAGTMRTNSDQERYIEAEYVIPAGSGGVTPVGLSNLALGGGDWHYDPVTGAVVSVDSGSNSYEIADGARYTIPDSGYPPVTVPAIVTVVLPPGRPLPDIGSYQVVTGVCSCKLRDGEIRPVVLSSE